MNKTFDIGIIGAMDPEVNELISRLEGTQCRGGTSCPDQLARAVKEALAK